MKQYTLTVALLTAATFAACSPHGTGGSSPIPQAEVVVDPNLDASPAHILVGELPSASAGTAFTNQTFSLTVKNARGSIIIGKYSTPITLTDSDTSGATKVTTKGTDNPPAGKLLSSSDTAMLSYTGLPIKPVTITASAGTIKDSRIFIVELPVFVADSGNKAVKEIPPGCLTANCVRTLGGGFTDAYGVAVDGSGNVFVAGGGVKKVPHGCVSAACVTTIGGGFSSFPRGVAVDGSGNVFVGDWDGNAVKKVPPGCVSAACVVTIGGGFHFPSEVALDASGNVLVADEGNNAIKKIPPGCLSAACVTHLGGGFNDPLGVAVDASGNVFVADFFNNAVKRMPPGCVRASCVTTIGGGWYYPESVAIDAFGDVFVADFRNNAVKKIPPGCITASCVKVIGGGFNNPSGVGIL